MLYSFNKILYNQFCVIGFIYNSRNSENLKGENMKHVAYNTFKQDKKLKQLERKKKRNDKQKALLVFWNDEDSKPISNK